MMKSNSLISTKFTCFCRSKFSILVAEGEIEVIRRELQDGRQVNPRNGPCINSTPLLKACGFERRTFEYLLKKLQMSEKVFRNDKKDYSKEENYFLEWLNKVKQSGDTFFANPVRMKIIELLLKYGADPNYFIGNVLPRAEPILPIHLATLHGRHQVMEILLAHGANPNIAMQLRSNSCLISDLDDNGFACLHFAAAIGDLQTVKILLRNRSPVDLFTARGRTALLIATVHSHHQVMEELLCSGANCNIMFQGIKRFILDVEIEGTTCLLEAIYNSGDDNGVSILLSHGAEVNVCGPHMPSPLQASLLASHASVIPLLLKHGASPNVGGLDDRKPLLLAACLGHTDILKQLICAGAELEAKNQDGKTALILAASEGHEDCLKTLLEHGAKANATSSSGVTALCIASHNNHIQSASLLLKHGADPNVGEMEGLKPLLLAACLGHTDILKQLLRAGAELEAKNQDGETALILAASEGHEDCLKTLLEHGAKANATSSSGVTALCIASHNNHIQSASLLLKHGADPNVGEMEGLKPLLLAACLGHTDILKQLLRAGAELEAKNQDGETALILAASQGRQQCLEVLLEHGSRADTRNLEGRTPLILSIISGFPQLADILLSSDKDLEIDAIDMHGMSALAEAQARGYTLIANKIICEGGNPEFAYAPNQKSEEVDNSNSEGVEVLKAAYKGFKVGTSIANFASLF